MMDLMIELYTYNYPNMLMIKDMQLALKVCMSFIVHPQNVAKIQSI
jgi:hypothetical protein